MRRYPKALSRNHHARSDDQDPRQIPTCIVQPGPGSSQNPVARFRPSPAHESGKLGKADLPAGYQARIENFYPWLLSLGNRRGGLSIVAGFRPACNTSLFCEHYLDQPIEELLGGSRKEIVEVGNLAPAIPGQARLMITMVTAFLHGAGFRQVVFTAVPKLYNAFHRLGLEPSELAVADPSRLPGGAEGWGTYYASGPRVYSGNIAWGHSVLAGQTGELENFRQCALKLGQRHGGHLWGKRK